MTDTHKTLPITDQFFRDQTLRRDLHPHATSKPEILGIEEEHNMNTGSKVLYSVLSAENMAKAVKTGVFFVPMSFPERRYWTQSDVGAEVLLLSASFPTRVVFCQILAKGIDASPYYGRDRRTLLFYIKPILEGSVSGKELMFRLEQSLLAPLNDFELYSSLKNQSKIVVSCSNPLLAEGELLPYQVSKNYIFRGLDAARDAQELAALAEHHPFGLAKADFEFVLTRDEIVVGAIQLQSGESEHNSHHMQRQIFGTRYQDIFGHSLTISRLLGPANLDERKKIHGLLLRGMNRVAPYLTTDPLSVIDCISYDYVASLLDANFRLESSGRATDSFYYWKAVFADNSDSRPMPDRRSMTAAYQSVKREREKRRFHAVMVNDRFWYLVSQKKMWALKRSVANNGAWKSLKSGDLVFFLQQGRFLRGYGAVSKVCPNNDPSISEFPLGIEFESVHEVEQKDISIEWAKFQSHRSPKGGLIKVSTEFAATALSLIRKERGGKEMWVIPNPLFINELDIETQDNELMAVMPFALKDTVYRDVKEICEKIGYNVTFATEIGGQVVMEDIWNLLARARAVIVDFTNARPNVYLEFGMAIVLGKPIIAITQDAADCPSDVKNLKYIQYPKEHARLVLKDKLPTAIQDTIAQVERIQERRKATP